MERRERRVGGLEGGVGWRGGGEDEDEYIGWEGGRGGRGRGGFWAVKGWVLAARVRGGARVFLVEGGRFGRGEGDGEACGGRMSEQRARPSGLTSCVANA